MVPLNQVLRIESRIVSEDGKKRFVYGKISSPDGETVYAEADAVFWVTKRVDFFKFQKKSKL